ncbi:MAG: hypothetical protein IPL58_06545 [Betaproteobacteria bacterium]|uniref:Uncharacterized protein n=1 Tax=Candidatus Proximibacter danicus TaxID=2954365 RepID=A0A9D7K1M7_9PROT|nr:hypothetical protein [Candidatus Proximibacter danicus]
MASTSSRCRPSAREAAPICRCSACASCSGFDYLLFDQPLLLEQRLAAGDEQCFFALQNFRYLRVIFGAGLQFGREGNLRCQRAVCHEPGMARLFRVALCSQ